ncbi:MAG: hypothetical protein ABSB99_05030 [Acidimicrobiales bacterium]
MDLVAPLQATKARPDRPDPPARERPARHARRIGSREHRLKVLCDHGASQLEQVRPSAQPLPRRLDSGVDHLEVIGVAACPYLGDAQHPATVRRLPCRAARRAPCLTAPEGRAGASRAL